MTVELSFRWLIDAASRRVGRARDAAMRPLFDLLASSPDRDCLYAVYDLNYQPVSFDLCWFLAAADLQRQRLGLGSIQLLFLSFERPFVHHTPPGHEDHVDDASMMWRIDNILLPLCSLLPSCKGATLLSSKRDLDAVLSGVGSVWPEHWGSRRLRPPLTDIYSGVVAQLASKQQKLPLQAPSQASRYIAAWRKAVAEGRDVVTITLRHHRGGAARNSNLTDWVSFAHSIAQDCFLPVFVPDTERAFELAPALQAFTVCHAAPWNMGLRMALYESAYLNLFVNSGPASLCMLSEQCRYLMFKVTTPSLYLTSADYLARLGFTEHTSPAFARRFQKWIWDNDDLPVLSREFRLMSEDIEHTARHGPR